MPVAMLDPGTALIVVPEMNRQPQDRLVTNRTWSAFANIGLETGTSREIAGRLERRSA